jgi:hypothetical protein
MKTISKKTTWVKTSGWHGYELPVNAVCAANDTGDAADSPCRTSQREEEINLAKKVLRAEKIKHQTMWGQTSNVFCTKQFIVVHPDDRTKAMDLIRPLLEQTSLLHLCRV